MSDDHLHEDDLFRFAGNVPVSAASASHLDGCAECRETVSMILRFDAALESMHHDESVDDEDEVPESRAVVVGFARRTAAEDAEARALLELVLATDELDLKPLGARVRTPGAVRVLSAESRAALQTQPRRALQLADAAIAIAESLPDDFYPSNGVDILRGTAWKERANALRFEGDYPAALEALDQAERAFGRIPLPDYYLGIVDYVRATVLSKGEQLDAALQAVRRCQRIFRMFSDVVRLSYARTAEASVLFKAGDYRSAGEIWSEQLETAIRDGDEVSCAGRLSNLALVDIELGDFARGEERLREAIALFERLGHETEAVRARWTLASLPIRAGRPHQAIAPLQRSLADCREREMVGDAYGVGLHLAEAYLALGRVSDVARLCESLVGGFVERNQLTSAMTAFAFLRDASASGAVSVETIRYVRKFLTRLEEQPRLLFAPPPHE